MKLSEYQGEDALDLMADIIDPLTEIMTDENLKKLVNSKQSRLKIVQFLLREHKKEIIEIMARLDGVEAKNFKCNFYTLPKMLLEILNDEGLADLFPLLGQMTDVESSGSAMENTEATDEG